MDDGARLGRPRIGLNAVRLTERLPGVYRFRIGIFEAAIVSDGPLTLPPAPSIFDDVAGETLDQALHAAFRPTGEVRVEQNCVLLDLGGHLVLIDNGMGTSTIFGAESGRLDANLAAVGVAPGQIDALVLTHAHPDHCWGTMRDDSTPAFPNAAIYLSGAEWDHWTAPQCHEDRLSAAGFARHLWPLRDRVVRIAAGDEFLPGLHAVASPGHTPGHLSIVIASADEEVCLLGDVAFHDILSFAYPQARSRYDADPVLAAVTRLRLLDTLAADRMRVLHYHAPWPGIGHVARDAAAFRWCPEPLRFSAELR